MTYEQQGQNMTTLQNIVKIISNVDESNQLAAAMGSSYDVEHGAALEILDELSNLPEIHIEAMAKSIFCAWATAKMVDFSWEEALEAEKLPEKFSRISRICAQVRIEARAVLPALIESIKAENQKTASSARN